MLNSGQKTGFPARRLLRTALFGLGGGAASALSLLLGADAPPAPVTQPPAPTTVVAADRHAAPSWSRASAYDPVDRMRPGKRQTVTEAFRTMRRHLPARTRKGRAACPPTSVICIENSLPGSPPSQWDVPTQGGIPGYPTQISVNKGQTVQFKVNTGATDYRIEIFRLGYYSGLGARQMATVQPSVTLPQLQPECVSEASTGLVDCGNWAVSASWAVPGTAVSGVYIANLIREDGISGLSQMIFVVRDDARQSEILLQTSDATWQAYNTYGGNSLYTGSPANRAFKVSYNRPFDARSRFFGAEYPMVRWIEANGYDVSYTSNIDTASRGAAMLNHQTFISSGHDEYWSNDMLDNAYAARNAGVNLAFFTGNEIFWKTRWEPSIDGQATPFRTLVCYKETLANAKIDPSPQWTGTWRDPRFSPPSDGGRPENALTGTLFRMNGYSYNAISVPAEFGSMRLWRNTSIAGLQPGQAVTFPLGTLGYEWDEAPDNGVAPAGLVKFSRTTVSTTNLFLLDFGSTYGAGTATHSLTLYKPTSNALVFGSGTVQWSWGLDAVHDLPGTPTNIDMQQATVNLFADMRSQPASLQPGLVPTTPSTDTAPPTSAINNPAAAGVVSAGSVVQIQGTAADTGGGVVAGVEVSVDGGNRWFQAVGRTNWTFNWTTPGTTGPVTIRTRAVDDIGNIQGTPTQRTVTVARDCPPCTLWPDTTVPATVSTSDDRSVELGVKFRATSPGFIRGVRFYKGALNTGTHTGSLWSTSGQLLATATFTNETASGWQQVNFSTPVAVTAGTTYIASYFTPTGHFAVNRAYFTAPYENGPLIAPADAASGGNGVYLYSATSAFPANTFNASNYWVDPVFVPSNSLWDDSTIPSTISSDNKAITLGVNFRASTNGVVQGVRFYKSSLNTGPHTGSLWSSDGRLLADAVFTNETASGWQQVTFSSPVTISAGTTYIASYHTPSGNYAASRQYFASPYTNGPLTAVASGPGTGNNVYTYGATNTFPSSTFNASNYWVDVVFVPLNSLWDVSTVPAGQSTDNRAVTLGVKFKATTGGAIQGVRFYKGPQNTGPHIGSLWTADGQLLASATFTNETATGWQQVSFPSPVTIAPNTTYIASYYTPSGLFSITRPYFTTQYVNRPLIALADGAEGGNAVYTYGAGNTFPTSSFQSSNYWVDVLFAP
ncbi:DUF4082 domain-containing protein [Nonomuraea cavernae]|uniref:DUF4082 domain-containing protein n=1 Tax=Nonomuraea cavernae TaxID=2045107 RepID=A0A918DGM6_9ACTN|nr:DUF4082 domain-containing protein [Nonomuraea cavernae]GGO65584.1 hypothetical protein GCM10012289_17620 [Nonomuraea cavernae]